MTSSFLVPSYAMPRSSSETERHLLAESIAPSETASIITDIEQGGERTPRANSPTRPLSEQSSGLPRHQSIAAPQGVSNQGTYRGFSSEAAYLAALRSWAEDRRYIDATETTLVGFYGTTTMAEYASRPAVLQPLGLRKKWKAMKASKQEGRQRKIDERRATIA